MPHIIVKLWPGKSESQKKELAARITSDVCETLGYGEESVSVGFEEMRSADWMEKVYRPDIDEKPGTIYKEPGYGPF